MILPITVVLPVGPLDRNVQYLNECIESIYDQEHTPDQVLVIDTGYPFRDWLTGIDERCEVMRLPWAVGIVSGYNIGIASARNNLCFMMGSDDKLMPNCLNACYGAWQANQEQIGWYYVGVQYSDGREQNAACMAAMVSKQLWLNLKGFELGSDYGFNSLNMPIRSCENVAISHMLINPSIGGIFRVSDLMLYWVRVRDNYGLGPAI